MVCCFFGHKDTPASIAPSLETVVEYIIRERNADEFLVENQSDFDSMVYRVLKKVNVVFHTLPTMWFLPICQRKTQYHSFMNMVKPYFLNGLKMYRQSSQSSGVINGWFAKLISAFAM